MPFLLQVRTKRAIESISLSPAGPKREVLEKNQANFRKIVPPEWQRVKGNNSTKKKLEASGNNKKSGSRG
ncbi:MAG: hypothetical protein DRG82_09145 [Deltaproteobacteria bacterium]|nr:MAG: hypothetical protein DRG82_09145 [Deltaproteobacteria bacterium]